MQAWDNLHSLSVTAWSCPHSLVLHSRANLNQLPTPWKRSVGKRIFA